MWTIRHNITLIALLNENPLKRWLTSIVVLIPKDAGKPRLHWLGIINTYESEYNLILKHFWSKVEIHKIEEKKWLGRNQIVGRKNVNSIEAASLNKQTKEVHRLMQVSLCIHQDDAKGFYDRIIHNHANLNNKKFLIPDNICNLYYVTHNNIDFLIQLHRGLSKKLIPIHTNSLSVEWDK